MSFLQNALALAEKGFYVFPLIENSKKPAVKNFSQIATRDKKQITEWWFDPHLEVERSYNIGISTNKFGNDLALVAVDVDNKGDKKGDDTLFELEMDGKDFPCTFTQDTPTGGKHLIYAHKEPIKQGVDKLGNGLDIRSKGGYLVGAGSVLDGKVYHVSHDCPISSVPEWLVLTLGKALEKKHNLINPPETINQAAARQRAIHYLENEAPQSIKGQGGDQTAYKVAARLKDLGIPKGDCLDLMFDHWFEGSGWTPEKLQAKIDHAYQYGVEEPGAAAPEVQFEPIPAEFQPPEEGASEEKKASYLEDMNKRFAVVYMEASHFIIHETIDEKGRPKRNFLGEQTFKRMFSPYTLEGGGTYATQWLDWKKRREYRGVCFAPERAARHDYYNLWRGFVCDAVPYSSGTDEQKRGFDMFMAHAKENICRGDQELFTWLMGYFAHMVQKPYERPLTTLVLRGGKGVGKNALIDRVGNLMGSGHYLVAHDGRYLTSNFNAHFDSCLCLVLDEAFWSGDKNAEGKLKGITTAPEILIERKGKEPYMVDNLVRLVIIGNDKWLVPASFDERRYAVLDVGNGRKQDGVFFQEMKEIIDDRGGNQLLLHYLKTFDLSQVNVNKAPATQALLEQKEASLEPFEQWWFDCLTNKEFVGSDFNIPWNRDVDKSLVRDAYSSYYRKRNIRGRLPDDRSLGRMVKEVCPSVVTNQKRREGSNTVNIYRLPTIEDAREEFEQRMGQKILWD